MTSKIQLQVNLDEIISQLSEIEQFEIYKNGLKKFGFIYNSSENEETFVKHIEVKKKIRTRKPKSQNKYNNNFKVINIIDSSKIDIAPYLNQMHCGFGGNFVGLFDYEDKITTNKNYKKIKEYLINGGKITVYSDNQNQTTYYNNIQKKLISDYNIDKICPIKGLNDYDKYYERFIVKTVNNWNTIIEKISKDKVDVFIMNPPYASNIHVNIFSNVLDIPSIKQVACVAPISYLFNENSAANNIDKQDNVKDYIQKYHSSIIQIDKTLFDAGNKKEVAIIHVNKEISSNKTYLKDLRGNQNIITDIYKIHPMSYNKVLDSFYDEAEKIIKVNGKISDICDFGPRVGGHWGPDIKKRIIYDENPNQLIVSLTSTRGNVGKDDFYTTIPTDKKVIQYKDNQKGKKTPWMYIKCNKISGERIIKYLKTDFVKLFLILFKTGTDFCCDIPLQEFDNLIFDKSISEIDEYLFSRYNVPQEVINIVKTYPDYYNIR